MCLWCGIPFIWSAFIENSKTDDFVEIYILAEFFMREPQETQSGYNSNTTLLLCLRVEEFFEGVSEEGNTGNTEWL